MADRPIETSRNAETRISYIFYVYRGIASAAERMYYFSSYFILPSSVRTFASIICDFFFHGRKATVTSGGEGGAVTVWLYVAPSSPTCPGDRTRAVVANMRVEGKAGGRARGPARSIREPPGGVAVPRPTARKYPSTPYRPPRGHCTGQWLSRVRIIIITLKVHLGYGKNHRRVKCTYLYYY